MGALQKLRRFSLAFGVVLFSYVVADFSVKEDPEINISFLVFEIGKPHLIPIGIVLGSAWGALLFWYYGFMVNRSPYRRRKELLGGGAKRLSGEHNYVVDMLCVSRQPSSDRLGR